MDCWRKEKSGFTYLKLINIMSRINYSSGTVWEDIVGYSRAVKVGNIIEVTGTVAVDENNKAIGIGDAYLQTRFILEKIEKILIFAQIRPCTSMIEVKGLISPDYLVEIEATAILNE